MMDENHGLEQNQALSEFCSSLQKPQRSYIRISNENFIKSLRLGYKDDSLICIFEDKPFAVQFRNTSLIEGNEEMEICFRNEKKEQKTELGQDLSSNLKGIIGEVRLQSVPYDCVEFREGLWMISNKSMPPRLYKSYPNQNQSQNEIKHIGSFSNKKKNSEQYLSPIQISIHRSKGNYAIGGGRRFLCSYDLQKVVQDQMYPSYDRMNVSAVQMLNENTLLLGTFEGALGMLDLREVKKREESNGLLRPHVDAIMSLATTNASEFIFASSARKDNFIYIWDSRFYGNDTKFVSELIQPRHGNQRISIVFSSDGKTLYTGSESSEIVAWQHEKAAENVKIWSLKGKSTVNSVVCKGDDSLIFSTGHRTFGDIEGDDQSQNMRDESKEFKTVRNVLGAISGRKEAKLT